MTMVSRLLVEQVGQLQRSRVRAAAASHRLHAPATHDDRARASAVSLEYIPQHGWVSGIGRTGGTVRGGGTVAGSGIRGVVDTFRVRGLTLAVRLHPASLPGTSRTRRPRRQGRAGGPADGQ